MSIRHTPSSANPALPMGCGTSGRAFSLRYIHPTLYRGSAACPAEAPLRPGQSGHKSGWVSFRPHAASQALGGRVSPWSSRRSSLAWSTASEAAIDSARSVSGRRGNRNRSFSPQAAFLGWTEVSSAEVLRKGRACGISCRSGAVFSLVIASRTLSGHRRGGSSNPTPATAPIMHSLALRCKP